MARFKSLCPLLVVLVLVMTSGCATITKGSMQPLTVHTDPDGASCDVLREQKAVASVGATPGQVLVERAWGSIDISCRKKDHQPTEVRVDSSVQGWTFGNILIGGLIGFAVDAATGAMRQYPQFLTLTLVPEEFVSMEERDAYIQQRLARFDEEARKAAEMLQEKCGDGCAADRKSLEDAKARRAALLREKIDKARIRQPQTAAVTPSAPAVPEPSSK